MSFITPSRRRLFQLAGAAALAPGLTAARRGDVKGRVLAVSDMHSAYERTARLLAAFEMEVRSNPVPHVIAINGDIFEHGNVVSVRSGGVVDWAFLAELSRIAPTVVNLGNHDNDLTPDLAEVVTRLKGLGLQVVSTIENRRTGAGYAEPVATLPFGARSLRVVGMATNSLNTYPKASREQLSILAADAWAEAHLADCLSGSDLNLVMSHAGVAVDRGILPLLPDGSLMIGGHNHLLFQHRQGRSAYAHTGSWTNAYTVAEFYGDGSVAAESRTITLDAPASHRLEALITATLSQHLTEEERFVMGVGPRALSLGDTGRRVAMGMASAVGADAGFIGHTTLGTGLPAGPVNRYVFDSIVRFDGKLMVVDVPRARLDGFMSRANQDRPMPLAERSGDFLYAAGQGGAKPVVRLVTTDWCATNQGEYFGATDLRFEAASGGVKAAAATALFA
jgi:5'-nucleotidase / UDP-sugar diphosphatase